MSFAVDASDYDRFMGRYSSPLAQGFCGFADVRPGHRVLDVGCGPGAFVAELVKHVGPGSVTAVDPSEGFVEAARGRFPEVDVRTAAAEDLPFPDDSFDAACAQLVVHFMSDPAKGIAEMSRVTKPGGVVAASVWDFENGRSPTSAFWDAAARVLGVTRDETQLAGTRSGQLAALLSSAGLRDVEGTELSVEVQHDSFETWWEPFTLGVGPPGALAATLSEQDLAAVREHCREILGDGPLTVSATAWAARGRV